MKSLHFIYNPVAGNGKSVQAFKNMRELLDSRNITYSFAMSEYPGHARELAIEAKSGDYSCIVAVGGDGTVSEVAAELLGGEIPFSFLPCGTGNDLARALNIPLEPEAVLSMLQTKQPQLMDVGTVNDKLFLNVAGFGFDVDVLLFTERYKKYFNGSFSYMLGLLHAVKDLKLRKVRIETDEGAVFERSALVIAAGNGTHIGGGMNITPQANPFDGLFDVCILSDVKRRTVFNVLSRFLKGRHLGLPITTYFTTTGFTAWSDPPSPLNCDGEILGQTPAVFKIIPNAISVIAGDRVDTTYLQ